MNERSRHRSGLDPTLVRNQPALRTSSGGIWLVVGAFFVAVSLVPLVLIIIRGGPAVTAAAVTSVALVVLFAAMLIIRFGVRPGVRRLRGLAACLLGIAAAALVGMLVCVSIVRPFG